MRLDSFSILTILFSCMESAAAIGKSIPPVVFGGQKDYSSLTNLANCISYTTSKDDIVMVSVESGFKIPSQKLNLRVFDSEDNTLRSMEDIYGEQSVIFTNLNNPIQIPQSEPKSLMGLTNHREAKNVMEELAVSGKSQVHICFDNVYFDKSWSFQKSSRDVHLDVSIRNITTLKQTNYQKYAKYFIRPSDGGAQDSDTKEISEHDFTESDFDTAVRDLQTMLNEVREDLKATEGTLQKLQLLENELRNVNESIFESFTRTTLLIIATICVFGVVQLTYIRFYLKRRRLL